jgi:hypothetical protein
MATQDLFTPYLKCGEKISWTGKPKQGLMIRDADMIAIPMSIMLLGFALLLDFLILSYDVAWIIWLSGFLATIGFIQLGIVRFFTASRRRKRMNYCLTNRRVLLIDGAKAQLHTLPLSQINRAEVTAEKDGSGHISFGNSNPVWPWLFGTFYFSSGELPGIELIPEVEKVYDLLVAQLQSQVDPEVIEKLKPREEEMN